MRGTANPSPAVLHSRLLQAGWLVLFLAIGAGSPSSSWACAVCYGDSDSPMAHGLNWGIFALLVVVVTVLGSITAFFVMTARRASALESLASALATQSATPSMPSAKN